MLSFSHCYKAEYKLNGQSVITTGDQYLSIEPQTVPMGKHGFCCRLVLRNQSCEDLFLHSAYPICIQQLNMDQVPSSQWMIMNQGRHKNDLPSVCQIGVRDDSFRDAVNRLSEQGILIDSTPGEDTELIGDQITIIHTPHCSLSLYFASAGTQLTEIRVPIDSCGNVGEILVGGTFGCLLASGSSICTEWAVVDTRPDTTQVIDSYASTLAHSMQARVAEHRPGVYCTWYYYGRSIDEANVLQNIRDITKRKVPFECFQIDAGWEQAYGDWESNEKFPGGMVPIAEEIKKQGMRAGIWTCPLIAAQSSALAATHPDWMLKHTDGSHCIFHMADKERYVLDCTNPAVIEWLEALYRRLSAWGYTYHKLDFTRAFVIQEDAVYYNPHLTPVQAYVSAMQAVRRGIGKDGYLLVCGGLFDPLIGICDAQRTGSDVLSHWKHPATGQLKVPYTIKQNVLRSFMSHWFHCDPDSLMVRRNATAGSGAHLSLGSLTDAEALTFTANQYFSGGIVCSTEPMDEIEDDRLYLLRHVMPTVPTQSRPFSLFDKERFIRLIDVTVHKGWHTLCAINWGDETIPLEVTLNHRLLYMTDDTPTTAASDEFYVSSFFGKKLYRGIRFGQTCSFGELPPHCTEIIKIAPMNTPQIVLSDAHFSMGGEVNLVQEGNILIASGHWDYPVPAHYTIGVPDGRLFEMTIDAASTYHKQFPLA